MADTPGDERTLRADEVDGHHVNIQEAEQMFNELSRALSRRSNPDGEKSGARVSSYSAGDVEKGGLGDEEDRFDLREYLQSSNDAHQSAGIKHKHVGITWEDLEVRVFGGEDDKVSGSVDASESILIAIMF